MVTKIKQRAANKAADPVVTRVQTPQGGQMLALRSELSLPRRAFARLLTISERSLATIETTGEASPNVRRRITEIRRLVNALSEVVEDEVIGPWLEEPQEAFDGLKPLEVIERGQIDRIWQMIYLLRSGTLS